MYSFTSSHVFDGHPSTPFWCFVAPESSSHPPVRSPLCAHQTEKASARHREEEIRRQ